MQAQASAGQEADAAKAARLRMEQLALRTSKQLMPVMPGAKSKAAAPTSLQPPPSLTPLKKPLGELCRCALTVDILHCQWSVRSGTTWSLNFIIFLHSQLVANL